jgi:uncharacterized membrane protein (UPF0127 family)
MKTNKKRIISLIIVIIVIIAGYLVFYSQFGEDVEEKAIVTFYSEEETNLKVTCEIADSNSEILEGLMHRENLPEDSGMLFVYETPQNVSFWMKNTRIPLDMIFIHENKTVLNIEEADVQSGVSDSQLIRYRSAGPVKWVVEINQGLSALNGITNGTQVEIEYID